MVRKCVSWFATKFDEIDEKAIGIHFGGSEVAVVARELALTFSESCVRAQVVKRTPGVANKLADLLSRRFQRGVHFVVPQALVGVLEVLIRQRTMDSYRSV